MTEPEIKTCPDCCGEGKDGHGDHCEKCGGNCQIVVLNNCVNCGADLTVVRFVACCKSPQPNYIIKGLMDG